MYENISYVYILANYKHTVFYAGVTSNLYKRMFEHSNELFDGFTKKYNAKQLLYYEIHNDIENAILREKKIKRWKKEWKWNMIDFVNKNHINLCKEGNILPLSYDKIPPNYLY